MQAKRAYPTSDAPWAEPAAARPQPRIAGDVQGAPASPALALRDELAARLARLAELDVAGSPVEAEPAKWPMSARLTVMVGLSLVGWGAIWLAVAQLV